MFHYSNSTHDVSRYKNIHFCFVLYLHGGRYQMNAWEWNTGWGKSGSWNREDQLAFPVLLTQCDFFGFGCSCWHGPSWLARLWGWVWQAQFGLVGGGTGMADYPDALTQWTSKHNPISRHTCNVEHYATNKYNLCRYPGSWREKKQHFTS